MKAHSPARFVAACLLITSVGARADVFPITSDALDAGIANNSGSPVVQNETGFALRIGEFFSPGVIIAVLPFQLPTLAAGEVFTDAMLRLQLFELGNGNGGLGNVDLYGLGARSTPNVLASDFYAGNTIDPNATLIQTDFLTPSSPVRTDAATGPFITTSPAASIALVDYVNTQYAGGANAGQYIFLRLSYDQNPSGPGNNFYSILSQDAGGPSPNEEPLLTLTSAPIPEPSSVALLAIGAGAGLVGLLRKRRAS